MATRSINKWIALTVVLSALMVTPAMAQLAVITDATVNYSNTPWSITVIGSGFEAASGTVTLGNTALKVSSWSTGQIVAQLPSGVVPGSYWMAVTPKMGIPGVLAVTIGTADHRESKGWRGRRTGGTGRSNRSNRCHGANGADGTDRSNWSTGSSGSTGTARTPRITRDSGGSGSTRTGRCNRSSRSNGSAGSPGVANGVNVAVYGVVTGSGSITSQNGYVLGVYRVPPPDDPFYTVGFQSDTFDPASQFACSVTPVGSSEGNAVNMYDTVGIWVGVLPSPGPFAGNPGLIVSIRGSDGNLANCGFSFICVQ